MKSLILGVVTTIVALMLLLIPALAQDSVDNSRGIIHACTETESGTLLCDPPLVDQGLLITARGDICVQAPKGKPHCGTEVPRATKGDTACIYDDEGQVWCGTVIARNVVSDPSIVCVVAPCPDGTVNLDDFIAELRSTVLTRAGRYGEQKKTN